ncbi:hypothetical protein IFM89_039861 [Coptis chinensis]|uniref:Uncharacterized protein n=1 Tax=Coptis chinensis TaxID=261450 RepID=A0A835LCR7_9MAGN|nr:hypothetical protein IFM89_039861 [Coptis chinensis]
MESCSDTIDSLPLTKHVDLSDENVDKACLSDSRSIPVSSDSIDNSLTLNHFFLDLRNLSMLKFLDLSGNNFSGRIPPSILSLTSLESLSLSETNIKDSISGCCELAKLQELNLSGNKFEEILPPFLNNLTSLRMVDFSDNQLSGNIPSSLIANLTSLEKSFEWSNKIVIRPIPPCFSNITFGKKGSVEHTFGGKIQTIYGAETYYPSHFDGSKYFFDIPVQYQEQEEVDFVTKSRSDSYRGDILNYMAGMDLSCNEFTGDIPHEIRALVAIRALNLLHNQLTGSIPKGLADLKQVESMYLSHNKLSGQIPSELIGINTLEVFIVALQQFIWSGSR